MFAFCFRDFPDIHRGYPTRMVSRRDTFAGKISLLFGIITAWHLSDHAPHLRTSVRAVPITIRIYAHVDNVLRFALLGGSVVKWACGSDPFWRPSDVVYAYDWHAAGLAPVLIWKAARVGGRRNRSLPYTTRLSRHVLCKSIWMTSNCRGHSFNIRAGVQRTTLLLKAGLYRSTILRR